MSVTELPPIVTAISAHLRQCLDKARAIKPAVAINPPLQSAELTSDISAFRTIVLSNDTSSSDETLAPAHLHYSFFETAARAILYERLASNAIHEDSFVDVWNLLDIVQACADQQQCDAGLTLWLVEEMLDSQTIEGCRGIFDYLESRRERLAAVSILSNQIRTMSPSDTVPL
jgi:THO complex subunit 1